MLDFPYRLDGAMEHVARIKRVAGLIDDLAHSDDPDIRTATGYLLIVEAQLLSSAVRPLEGLERAIDIAKAAAHDGLYDLALSQQQDRGQFEENSRWTVDLLEGRYAECRDRIARGDPIWRPGEYTDAGREALDAVLRAVRK
jgi:hypothetical protein